MKHNTRLRKIAQILQVTANKLEEVKSQLKLAKAELKEKLKQDNLNLAVETRQSKNGYYLKVTYTDEKPNLPEQIRNIEIKLAKKNEND